jgi:hypothetical protein
MPSASTSSSLKAQTYEESKINDLKNEQVPSVMYWSVDQVCNYFANDLQLPQYKETLKSNNVNGSLLIHLHASNLPKLGIQDFKEITVRYIDN